MKKLILLCLCLCLSFTIAGCGSEKEEEYFETTLSFDKDGKITDVIVESFSEDYYSEEGLRAYFQEKISDYNSTNIGTGEIKLSDLFVGDGRAKATLVFDNSDTYFAFYGTPAFYGTISDAYDKGYIQETVLKKVGESKTISKIDLMKMSDANIIVVSEVVRIHSPNKIEYTSANVELIDEKNARVSSDSTGLAYIVVK
ncbi:MAG: hypothetical protein Q4D29_09750 [Lachnospiraceae bacterium]|nr:hypothetical protein [Lachnospiraceae bacterium]